jgi:cytochrome c-type biogenesis protein CcmH/NrfG
MNPIKNLEDADKVLRQALTTGPANPDTLYYAAVVAVANKHADDAKTLLKEAMKSTVPWTMKGKAKELLDQLNKE